MENPTLNLDGLFYDYAHPVQEVEHLYGRQSELEAVKQIMRRAEGGLYLVIGGSGSGRTSLLRSVGDLYSKELERYSKKAQAQTQAQAPGQTYLSLPCSLSLASELTRLDASEQSAGSMAEKALPDLDQVRLHKLMMDSFNVEDLQTLCFQMNEDYERIVPAGREKEGAVRDLILYFVRQRRVKELLDACVQSRPLTPWQTVYDKVEDSTRPSTVATERLRAGKLCEAVIRGLRERARDLLGVCSIESYELEYLPHLTPKDYVEQAFQKVRKACLDKVPGTRLKLVALMDDADELLERTWRLDWLGAFQDAFKADLVLILAGGRPLYTAASQEAAWRNLSKRQVRLGNLNREAVRVLAEEPLDGGHFPEAFLAGVHQQTGGQPYLLKFFLNNIESREELIANPEPDRLAQSGRSLVSQEESIRQLFDKWSATCGEAGQWVYRLLLDARGSLARGDIVQRTSEWNLSNQLDSILNTLCYQGIATRTVNGIESYSIAGEMFAGWFRENILPGQRLPQVVPARPVNIFASPKVPVVQAASGQGKPVSPA